jgi:chromosomal replication initiator protein
MYLMREELKNSYPSIGQEVGNRDHTTAMHAHLKISRVVDEDEKINQDIRLIKEKLYN